MTTQQDDMFLEALLEEAQVELACAEACACHVRGSDVVARRLIRDALTKLHRCHDQLGLDIASYRGSDESDFDESAGLPALIADARRLESSVAENLERRLTTLARLRRKRFLPYAATMMLTLVVCFGFAALKYQTADVRLWGRSLEPLKSLPLKVLRHEQGWGSLGLGKSADGKPIIVAGSTHLTRSIGTHAPSRVEVAIDGEGSVFAGACAYPDRYRHAAIRCKIRSGENVLFQSRPLHDGRRIESFAVAIPENRRLSFEVESVDRDLNQAHAAWIELQLRDGPAND